MRRGMEPTADIVPLDPRLEQLRFLLLGREIHLSRHFSHVLDDPEQHAIASFPPQSPKPRHAMSG
jgi:hypothetical protein